MKDLIVENILGVEVKALCNDGNVHTVGWTELLRPEGCTYGSDKKMVNNGGEKVEKYIIDIHLECEGYDTVVDGIKVNLLSYGKEE